MNKYPKWKIEYMEQSNKKQFSYEVLGYTISIKLNEDDDWISLYRSSSREKATLAFNKLKHLYYNLLGPYFKNQYIPAMVKCNNQIYKVVDINVNDSIILAKQITNNNCYGTYTSECVKINYAENIIRIYDFNDMLIHNCQVFLDGDLILNTESLDDIAKELQHVDKFSLYLLDENVIDCLFSRFSSAERCITDVGCYVNPNK